jgi:hypothetical protein
MEGGREAQLGSDSGLNTQSGLNCTGRVPSPRGPGYHRIYGETTKHAPEASVLRGNPSMVGWNRGRSMPPDPAWVVVLGWRTRIAFPTTGRPSDLVVPCGQG